MTCPCVRYRPEWQCDCDGPLTEEERALWVALVPALIGTGTATAYRPEAAG